MAAYYSKKWTNFRAFQALLCIFFGFFVLTSIWVGYQFHQLIDTPMLVSTPMLLHANSLDSYSTLTAEFCEPAKSMDPLVKLRDVDKGRAVTLRLDPADSAAVLACKMHQANLIQSERFFLWLIRIQGLSAQLKAGIYDLRLGETAQQFLHRVVSGDVLKQLFLIKPGVTQAQVDSDLAASPYVVYRQSDWTAVNGHDSNAEGQLLADSYQYDAGSSSKQILSRAHANLQRYLIDAWHQRAPALPYHSPYQLLIAASILEKETALAEEKRLISGVIINRLKKFMPLQMDPTVIYALKSSYHGKLKRSDLAIDSPYNTYRYRGLPPTPIAMVGKDAIDAAAHPTISNYLYFVARGDGTHQFSATYDEQKKAINRFLK